MEMDNKKELNFLVNRSNQLHQKYIKEPIYINALSIKNVNSSIIDFLLVNGWTFENDEIVNTVLSHYEGWYFQFLEHEKQGFDLTSKFVFNRLESVLPYPKVFIRDLLK